MKNSFGRKCSDSEHIKTLGASVLVTNVCNLSCGGCSVLCGVLKKESNFFITPEQFRIDVSAAGRHYWWITLYGGEPTIHPHFENLLDICENEFPALNFQVFTNGFKPFRERKNVCTRLDEKKKGFNRIFVSSLVASQDMAGIKSKDFYWELARNRCGIFNSCNVQISDGKAYICQTAASLERLHGTDKGWKVEIGKDPFIRTDEEIAEQGRAFCHKCTYCMRGDLMPKQESKDPSVVSITNIGLVNKKHRATFRPNPRVKLDPEVRKEATRFLLLS
jgi:hypothetical protein